MGASSEDDRGSSQRDGQRVSDGQHDGHRGSSQRDGQRVSDSQRVSDGQRDGQRDGHRGSSQRDGHRGSSQRDGQRVSDGQRDGHRGDGHRGSGVVTVGRRRSIEGWSSTKFRKLSPNDVHLCAGREVCSSTFSSVGRSSIRDFC